MANMQQKSNQHIKKSFMKKNIKKMSIAAIAALAMVSCSHEEGMSYEEFRTVQYNAAFVQKYGTIDSNHTWGFGSAVTRAAAEFGWEKTEDYGVFEAEVQQEILKAFPEGVKAENIFNNYEFTSAGPFTVYPLYGQTSNTNAIGYYYYNPVDGIETAVFVDPFLENAKSLSSNDFYYSNGTEKSWMTPEYVFGQGANGLAPEGYKIYVKGYTINIPIGYRVGFYLKNGEGNVHYSNTKLNEKGDYYSAVKLYDNGHLYFGLEDWDNQYNNSDLDCNDIVFGITSVNLPTPVDPDEVPEETPKNEPEYNEFGTPVSGRIFCEDLGSTGDFDFNDVVFDADIAEDNSTTIVLLAAGGIYDITVAGVHIHDVLGDGIVNTGVKEGVESYTIKLSAAEATAMGISYAAGIGSIPVKVYATTDAGLFTEYELRNTVGGAPQKICVGQSTKWVIEYEDIVNAYPSFKSWVQDSKTANTFTDGVEKYLY